MTPYIPSPSTCGLISNCEESKVYLRFHENKRNVYDPFNSNASSFSESLRAIVAYHLATGEYQCLTKTPVDSVFSPASLCRETRLAYNEDQACVEAYKNRKEQKTSELSPVNPLTAKLTASCYHSLSSPKTEDCRNVVYIGDC